MKPRLSRVKGEAWAKAKRKVEANTAQMAEDVLALYATRETLNRPHDSTTTTTTTNCTVWHNYQENIVIYFVLPTTD